MSWQHLTARNWLAFALIMISLVLLYPGLTEPMLNLTISAKLPLLGTMEFYNKTQSIWSSISSLFESGNTLVAILILLFSVVIPVIKACLLLTSLFCTNPALAQKLHAFVSVIGKWSMADVFAVGVFMAFLAGNAHPSAKAELFGGFYFFSAYCVVSILSAQVLRR